MSKPLPNGLRQLVGGIDRFTELTGRAVSWLSTALVLLVCYNVLMRYAFNSSRIFLTELEWHLFSALFLLGAAYALKSDAHVRVDVLYSRFAPRYQGLVNVLGTLLFLMPFCYMVIRSSLNFAHNSWMMNESSSDPGGLPARYLIKFTITLGFVLLMLQALSLLISSGWQALRGHDAASPSHSDA